MRHKCASGIEHSEDSNTNDGSKAVIGANTGCDAVGLGVEYCVHLFAKETQ